MAIKSPSLSLLCFFFWRTHSSFRAAMQTDIRFPPEGLQQNWRRIADSKNTQNTGIYNIRKCGKSKGEIGKSRAVTRCRNVAISAGQWHLKQAETLLPASSMGLVFVCCCCWTRFCSCWSFGCDDVWRMGLHTWHRKSLSIICGWKQVEASSCHKPHKGNQKETV